MENLEIYEKVRAVPENAKKTIRGGRLSGMTDINPMWRIKTLTELFGIAGFGWKYEIIDKRLELGANDEICAFVDINLYVKYNGEWSEAIQGTGGSTFVANEKNGLYTSDECFKMALTDAISVACKCLGIGADVYWNENTKYPSVKNDEPMTYEKALDFEITFGKHKGKKLCEIWKEDFDYIKWLENGEKTDAVIKEAIAFINAEIKKNKAK